MSAVAQQHSTIDQLSAEWLPLIDVALHEAISSSEASGVIKNAVLYSVFPAGKRLRPLFALYLAADLGARAEDLISTSAAIELLHCASLVHDDLPALDNDDERRGRASCHCAFSEATAILAGDLLIACAHAHVAASNLDAEKRVAMSSVMATAFMDVCRGQQLDLEPRNDISALSEIHRLKTGALFACAARFAAIFAGLNRAQCRLAADFGSSFGLVFQILDDYLDCFGSAQERGRTQSSDARNQKLTFFNSNSPEQGKLALQSAMRRFEKAAGYLELSLNASSTSLLSTRALLQSLTSKAE